MLVSWLLHEFARVYAYARETRAGEGEEERWVGWGIGGWKVWVEGGGQMVSFIFLKRSAAHRKREQDKRN